MNKVTARGIKTPLIKTGQNLAEIVVNSLLADADQENYQLHDGDVIGITEAVVSIAYNNFATLDEIAADINNKFKGNALGVVFPIFSRNRFSMLLKAFARAKKELYLLMSYPNDEVGNPILKVEKLKEIKEDVFDDKVYFKNFKDYLHPWTKMNIVDYYLKIMKEEKAKGKIIFSNNALDILN
ncbi:MAG: coenzyme F420-0:L-glutamate ligase, partial [Acholeplasmataceae bacterium]|nr:coenzyme F420-0:L-glutamate ligase [Acholeplasmataceae bacterium]